MKNKLSQYVDLKKEIEELNQRVVKTQNELAKIKEDGEVLDTVKGGYGGTQHFKIEGFPNGEYYKKEDLLYSRVCKLERAERKRITALNEIEEFIESIDDSHIRRIIGLRYVDGLSWDNVAYKMGASYTADSVRKSMERYLKS